MRNKGTIGGSCVHADPAGDWPAAMLALDAEFEITGPRGSRTVAAIDFFVDMLTSAVEPGEILKSIHVPVNSEDSRIRQDRAEGERVCACRRRGGSGQGAKECRRRGHWCGGEGVSRGRRESSLRGLELSAATIATAAQKAADGIDPLSDIHASAEFRAHLARVQAKRALELAASRG